MAEIDLNSLDPDAIAQAEDFLVTFLKESYPSMDLSEGRVLRDLLIKPAALFYVLNNANVSAIQRSQSMLEVQKDPALATPEIVDAILSNYRITRNPGAKSSGQVVIVVENDLVTSVQSGTVFQIGELSYVTQRAFVGVTTAESAALDPTTQREIFPRVDGKFSFLVDVVSVSVGLQYNLRRNTTFEEVTPPPAGLITAYVYQDFRGGANSQTNEELVALFKQSLSPQVFSGRIHIESLIRASVPQTQTISIIGFGDPEMLRDRHNIFAISQGGKADLYLRTSSFPQSQAFTLSATLIDADLGTWQISIDRDLAPGFYVVEAVLPLNSTETQNTLPILSEVRQLNLSPDTNEFVPDVANLVEGAYSRYQTAIVQFTDTDLTDAVTAGGITTKDYSVFIQAAPLIKNAQVLSSDRGSRNPQADYLVRAAVPAYVSISLEVQFTNDSFVPDAAAIKQSIVDAINGIGFTLGRLPVSLIHDAVHNVMGTNGVLVSSPVDMFCRIRKPAGDYITLRNSNALTIPNLPAEGVSSRTTLFYASLNDIDLALTKVAVLPV